MRPSQWQWTASGSLWAVGSRFACIAVAVWGLSGCQMDRWTSPRQHEFAHVSASLEQSVSRSGEGVAFRPATGDPFSGEYSLDEFVAIALSQHPKVQAAKWDVDAAAWQVPVAASLEDPKFAVTALPAPIETAAGPQNVQVGISQKLPIREKQRRKTSIAHAAAEEARARLAAAEREVITQVHDAYAELLFGQEALAILDDERQLLAEVTQIIIARYPTNSVSQQDIAQAELAQLEVERQRIAAELALQNAQSAMARLVRVSPDTALRAREPWCPVRLHADVQEIMDQAVASRPELHAMIQHANQERWNARLAKLDYVPDATIGATWVGIGDAGISPVSNGDDAVLLNVSMNLPLYRRRIEGKVKSAEAKAIGAARAYDDLRDETLRSVQDRYSQLEAKRQLIDLLRAEMIPKAIETLTVSVRAYGVSKVDIQQVLASCRNVMRLELSLRELERDYRRSLAALERVVGTDLSTFMDCERIQRSNADAPSLEEGQTKVETRRRPPETNPMADEGTERDFAEPMREHSGGGAHD